MATVCRDATPSGLVGACCFRIHGRILVFHLEDEGKQFLRNTRTYVQNYTACTSATINNVFPLQQLRCDMCVSGSPTHWVRLGVANSMPPVTLQYIPWCNKPARLCAHFHIVSSGPIKGFPKTLYRHRALRDLLVGEVHYLTTGRRGCGDGHIGKTY